MQLVQPIPNGTPLSYSTIIGLESVHDRKTRRVYLHYRCQCKCGKEFLRRKDDLDRRIKNKSSETLSCGCLHPSKGIGKHNHNWKGYEEVSSSYLAELEGRGRKRKYKEEFNLTPQNLWELYLKQDKKCALTNIPIFLCQKDQRRSFIKEKGKLNTASIDRIDSAKGYTLDNVQWVHKHINKMKNEYEQNYFIEMCKLVAQNN